VRLGTLFPPLGKTRIRRRGPYERKILIVKKWLTGGKNWGSPCLENEGGDGGGTLKIQTLRMENQANEERKATIVVDEIKKGTLHHLLLLWAKKEESSSPRYSQVQGLERKHQSQEGRKVLPIVNQCNGKSNRKMKIVLQLAGGAIRRLLTSKEIMPTESTCTIFTFHRCPTPSNTKKRVKTQRFSGMEKS